MQCHAFLYLRNSRITAFRYDFQRASIRTNKPATAHSQSTLAILDIALDKVETSLEYGTCYGGFILFRKHFSVLCRRNEHFGIIFAS